jgi:putative oxidoreductase
MKDLALLIIRLISGGLLAGHGSQKLFGWFDGPGLEGTADWLASLGLQPKREWAIAAGMGEFGGGLLTALGLFHPLGSIGTMAAMAVATGKVHWGNPIWVTEGGAELPLTNATIALALWMAGPGRLSLDELLGTGLPKKVSLPIALASAYAVTQALGMQPVAQGETQGNA